MNAQQQNTALPVLPSSQQTPAMFTNIQTTALARRTRRIRLRLNLDVPSTTGGPYSGSTTSSSETINE